jgi:hypothetical protein
MEEKVEKTIDSNNSDVIKPFKIKYIIKNTSTTQENSVFFNINRLY